MPSRQESKQFNVGRHIVRTSKDRKKLLATTRTLYHIMNAIFHVTIQGNIASTTNCKPTWKFLTFRRSKPVWAELLLCQSCSLKPATGCHSAMACSTVHEVHFSRCSSYRDQQHRQHNCMKPRAKLLT